MGCLYRGQGKMEAAVGFLSQALTVANEIGEPEVRASVLCNLGAAQIAIDAEQAMTNLQEAVDIREQQVCVVLALHVLSKRKE